MRTILLTMTAAAAALASEPPAKLISPVLGYVFDSTAKAVRPITGIPGAASLEATVPNASKLANGFVSQNREWLLAVLLDGGAELVNLHSGATATLEGAPQDVAFGAWNADGTALTLWSRSGILQVWNGLPDAPVLKFSHQAESAAGIALADSGEAVLGLGPWWTLRCRHQWPNSLDGRTGGGRNLSTWFHRLGRNRRQPVAPIRRGTDRIGGRKTCSRGIFNERCARSGQRRSRRN